MLVRRRNPLCLAPEAAQQQVQISQWPRHLEERQRRLETRYVKAFSVSSCTVSTATSVCIDRSSHHVFRLFPVWQVTLPAEALSNRSRVRFQKEERLRYTVVPGQGFRYTAVDGGKSTVAPLLRAGGKSQGKARDHVMLMLERPPQATVLSLVRDAASRLPKGMGTRSDVCALLRDSQYIIQETSDAQVRMAANRR